MIFGFHPFDLPPYIYVVFGFLFGYFLNTKILYWITGIVAVYVAYYWLTVPWESWGPIIVIALTGYAGVFLLSMWGTAKRTKILQILKAMKSEALNKDPQ